MQLSYLSKMALQMSLGTVLVLALPASAAAGNVIVIEFNGTQRNLANPLRGFRFECTLGDGPDAQNDVADQIQLVGPDTGTVAATRILGQYG